MDSDKLQKIQDHAWAIAAILYQEADPEQLTSLKRIESTVPEQVLEYVSPEIGVFLSQRPVAPAVDGNAGSKVSLENCPSPSSKPRFWVSNPKLNWVLI
jgi:hypothetical protein